MTVRFDDVFGIFDQHVLVSLFDDVRSPTDEGGGGEDGCMHAGCVCVDLSYHTTTTTR